MAEVAGEGVPSQASARTFLGLPLGWWVVAACAICVASGWDSFSSSDSTFTMGFTTSGRDQSRCHMKSPTIANTSRMLMALK